jgi:hypothetical protein
MARNATLLGSAAAGAARSASDWTTPLSIPRTLIVGCRYTLNAKQSSLTTRHSCSHFASRQGCVSLLMDRITRQ